MNMGSHRVEGEEVVFPIVRPWNSKADLLMNSLNIGRGLLGSGTSVAAVWVHRSIANSGK